MKKISRKILFDTGDIFISCIRNQDPDSDPAVVFVHGWGSDHKVWNQSVSSCQQTTLAIDLPGFGQSPVPSRPLSVDDYADAVSSAIKQCELNKVILVGHSFGGQIVTALAARQPSWLIGIVLVDSASLRKENPPLLSRLGAKLSTIFKVPLLRKLRPLAYKIIGADVPPENKVMQKTMRTILRENQADKLNQISVPALVVWGRNDEATPLSEGKFIAQKIPKAKLITLKGGHFVFLDQPTVFNDALASFINKVT